MKIHYEQAKQSERLSFKTFEHLKHQLDFEAAENDPKMHQNLIELQQIVAGWFSQYLTQS